MNPEIKKHWVDALRSGKYGQAQEALRSRDYTDEGWREGGYCCLGVLCDLSGLGKWRDGFYVVSEADYDWGDLPQAVVEWAGVENANPDIDGYAASYWNDAAGKTFTEIADLIEEHL